MMTFVGLFREGQKANPLDNGRLARSKAQEMLSAIGITFKSDVSPISIQNGAIIGIAFYSLPDLELLDQLILARRGVADSGSGSMVIFDVLTFKTAKDFERLIPSIGSVYQTPVVGIWKDGKLFGKGTGAAGRMLVSRHYNLQEW